MHMTDFKIDST